MEENRDPYVVLKNGEMRIETDLVLSPIRNTRDLESRGIKSDTALNEFLDDENMVVIDSPWFDLYDGDGEHLDRVHHSLADALEDAVNLSQQKPENNARECRPSELIDYLNQFDDGDVINDCVLDGFFEERAEKMKENQNNGLR